MNSVKLVAIIISFASIVVFNVESACVQDSCQHNYGRKLAPQYQVQATLIAYVTVPAQNSGYDPIPCCIKCNQQPGCNYYYLEFANGNCTLFTLPTSDSFVMNLVAGRYYDKTTYEGCCIGYTNTYLFQNMPEMPYHKSNSSNW